MKGTQYFEEISAGAISPQMPSCKAIIINIGNRKGITGSLQELYSALNYKIYVVNITAAKLKATLKRCAEAGVVAIVNCGTELPSASVWHPGKAYSAALVSPNSYDTDIEETDNSNYCHNIINQIFADEYVAGFSNIGYQSYRYNPQILNKFQTRYFEHMRLGALRSNITLCEPLVRDCNYAFLDMRAVRYSDYPSGINSNPNGLYAEEICTIARYIGLGSCLKAVFVFGMESDARQLTVCNKLVAETIWHLCEGIASNIPEDPINEGLEDYFSKKVVSMGDNGENITFITSATTQRWWMEIPVNKEDIQYIPCSLEDYRVACKGEVPLKWLFFYQKYAL